MFNIGNFLLSIIVFLPLLGFVFITGISIKKRRYFLVTALISVVIAVITIVISNIISLPYDELYFPFIIIMLLSAILYFDIRLIYSIDFKTSFVLFSYSLVGYGLYLFFSESIIYSLQLSHIYLMWYIKIIIYFISLIIITISFYTLLIKNVSNPGGNIVKKESFISSLIVVILSLVIIPLKEIIAAFANLYATIYSLTLLGYYIVIFLMDISSFKNEEIENEVTIIKSLWEEDKKKYQHMVENNEIINLTIHDLKHQIHDLKHEGLTDQMVDKLEKSLKIKDAYIKSGNDTVDVILYNFYLRCLKDNITFTSMVDGSLLNFLNDVEIYSLLGNILDNAIEYLLKEDIKDKFISLKIYKEGALIIIHSENNYQGEPIINAKNIKTSKNNEKEHGFGLKSIEHIVKQYDGNISVYTEDEMFQTTIKFLKLGGEDEKE